MLGTNHRGRPFVLGSTPRERLAASIVDLLSERRLLSAILRDATMVLRRSAASAAMDPSLSSATLRRLALVAALGATDEELGALCYRFLHARGMQSSAVVVQELRIRVRANPALVAQAAADLAGGPASAQLFRATLALAEAAVVVWLVKANVRGVAASTAQLASELRVLWPRAARGVRARVFLLRLRHVKHARRNWANRFRRRWGVCWRKLQARADLSPATIRARASWRPKLICFCIFAACLGPRKWVHFWYPYMGPSVAFVTHGGPKAGPENGTQIWHRFAAL